MPDSPMAAELLYQAPRERDVSDASAAVAGLQALGLEPSANFELL